MNQAATGVVVDGCGFVLVPANALEFQLPMARQFRQGVEMSAVPSDIRVIFPGDTREYPAILGAKDSKLNLAFFLIKELGDCKPVALDTTRQATPKIGDTLYGVSRLEEGFDNAPVVSRARICGQVTKPRDMWALEGGSQHVGEPLYDHTGAIAGIVATQQAVGDDAERHFLLPLKIAIPTIARALKTSQEELDRIREEEAEAKKKAAEEAPAPKPEGDGEPKKDGPAPGEGG
jgi:hypothetical protein